MGGSTGVVSNGISTLVSHIVSETEALSTPAIATISPATASSIGYFSIPLKLNNFVNFVVSLVFAP